MLATSACCLVLVWWGTSIVDVAAWRSGSTWRTAVMVAVPAVWAVLVAAIVRRESASRWDWRRLVVFLLVCALSITAVLVVSQLGVGGRPGSLGNLLWWAVAGIVVYVTVPVVYARLNGQRVRTYGLSVEFLGTEARLFLLIVPVIAGIVWLASADVAFQAKYPFLNLTPFESWAQAWPSLLGFELAYGARFVALEFFFRGFMMHAGARIIGVHAVPVMAFFYCFLHVGKPLPEVVASLVGGLILGYLSLRLRSIAVGVAAHLTLAWGVDAAVVSRTGL